MKISVTVLVKNSEETLEATLNSVRAFPEVVLLDTGSTDATLQIAEKFSNVKVFHAPFQGFGPTHNLLSSLATYDFILSLDSDEVLSFELVEEIGELSLDPNCIYSITRDNYYLGKHIKGCSGWYPDFVTRLYNRKSTSFDDAAVHEKIIQGPLKKIHLKHSMSHTPYRKVADFLHKMQTYTTLFAEQNKGRKASSLGKAILHGFACFFKSYILKRGFLFGYEGFFISLYNGHTAFYKYIKLLEANRKL
ncbi:MAG: glycosyltransferase family 2 protein [Chlamydiota bacterium]